MGAGGCGPAPSIRQATQSPTCQNDPDLTRLPWYGCIFHDIRQAERASAASEGEKMTQVNTPNVETCLVKSTKTDPVLQLCNGLNF